MPSKPTFYVLLGILKGRKLIRWKLVPELVPDAKERHSHIAVVLIRSDAHPNSEANPCIPTGTMKVTHDSRMTHFTAWCWPMTAIWMFLRDYAKN
jgi:hypothetical protein